MTKQNRVRHAVITGAAEGIGRAVAEVLGVHGYRVTGIDMNIERARQTADELAERGQMISFLPGDLSRCSDVERLAASLCEGPAIDVLVHNTGINCVGAFGESDLTQQEAVLNVNLRAPLQLTTALLHADQIVRGGSLIFVSSLSRFVSYPGAAVYGASKDALAAYARSLAVALAPAGHPRDGGLSRPHTHGSRQTLQSRQSARSAPYAAGASRC